MFKIIQGIIQGFLFPNLVLVLSLQDPTNGAKNADISPVIIRVKAKPTPLFSSPV